MRETMVNNYGLSGRKTKLEQISMVLLWIQCDLFRKNKLPGSKKVNLVKFMLRVDQPNCNILKEWEQQKLLNNFSLFIK